RREAHHRFAVAERTRAESVAGGEEQLAADGGNPALRPDAAAARPRRPAHDSAGLPQRHADNPAAIVAAGADVAALCDVERAVDARERGALGLLARPAGLAARAQRVSNVDRDAGQNGAVLEREAEDAVARSVCFLDHGIEINGFARRIDHRRAGDAER